MPSPIPPAEAWIEPAYTAVTMTSVARAPMPEPPEAKERFNIHTEKGIHRSGQQRKVV